MLILARAVDMLEMKLLNETQLSGERKTPPAARQPLALWALGCGADALFARLTGSGTLGCARALLL